MEHSSAKALPKSGESTFPELSTKSQRVVWNPITLALPVLWPSFTIASSRYLVTKGSGYRPPDRQERNGLTAPRAHTTASRLPPCKFDPFGSHIIEQFYNAIQLWISRNFV